MERPDGGPKATEEKRGTKPVHADPSAVRQEAAAAVTPSTTTERSDLIDLAVKFLNNPRVQGSPMDQKMAFLRKKGLTTAEVDKAVELAKKHAPPPVLAANPPSSNQIEVALPPTLPIRPPPLPPRSRSWQEYVLMSIVIGGVGYAVVQFIRRYIFPWLEGPQVQHQKLNSIQTSVQELQNSVNTTVASLNESTQAIRELLSEQQQHLELLKTQVSMLQGNLPTQQSLREVKEEVGSLKGILLSRHQFPPTPTRQPNVGIPVWQRAQSSSTSSSTLSTENQKPPSQPVLNGLENGGSSDELTLPGRSEESPQD